MNDLAQFFMWRMTSSGATPLFGVGYRIPGQEHTLGTGMYEWQAKWLVAKLNKTGEYPQPPSHTE